MRFAEPEVLWLLWALPMVWLVLLFARGVARRRLQRLTGAELLTELAGSVRPGRRVVRAGVRLTVLSLLVLAAARPQWGASEVKVEQEGVDLIVALDISRSMLAEDVKPDRLTRAKAEIGDFIAALAGDRVGLVFFAGAAFPQCPLTVDYAAARLFLAQADPSMIPSQGTNIAAALGTALELFEAEEGAFRAVILVTDGEDFGGGLDEVLAKLRDKQVRVFAIGIGNSGGAPIPDVDDSGMRTGFVRDKQGNVVMSRLEEGPLIALAQQTDGAYLRAGSGGVDISRLRAELSALQARGYESRSVVSYQERYAWPLVAALLLLLCEGLLGDRRRVA
jgi:Ca-activated chloride channel family protein